MTLFIIGWLFVVGTIVGSFINVLAVRVMAGKSWVRGRSECPACLTKLRWFELVPLASWLFLRGRCRSCTVLISPLYPAVEATYGIILVLLFYRIVIWSGVWELQSILFDLPSWSQVYVSFVTHAFFFGALLAAARTDVQTMLIPQLFSLWLVPVGLLCSVLGMTEISILESMGGALAGYFLLWSIAWIFKKYTQRDGIGEGDFELLAMIGSFLGPLGVWFAVLVGSTVGIIFALPFVVFSSAKNLKIALPFGPFLALGAWFYFLFKQQVVYFFLGL